MLAAIVALALLLRLPGFNESVWYDELWSTRVILESFPALLKVIATDAHPPFYAVVMFAWIRVFGDSEISIRILPLLCGLLTIVLVARLAVAYGGPRAGPVAASILAISPPHIWYSQEARQYSLLVLLVVSCTWAFHRIRESHSTRWYVAYAVFGFCMVFTHYFAIAYLAAFTALALPDPRARARMLWIGAAITSVLVFYLAVRWRFDSLPTQLGHLRGFGVTQLWRLMFEWYVAGGVFGRPRERDTAIRVGILVLQLVLLGLLLRGLYRARVEAGPGSAPPTRWDLLGRRWELAILLLVLPLGLLAMGLVGARRFYIERSALSALPFFAVGLGIGITSFRSARWRALGTGLIAAFGVVVLISYYRNADRFTVYMPNPDWRAAAQWVQGRSTPGRPAVIVSVTPSDELLYYGRGFGLVDTPLSSRQRHPGSVRERLRLYLSSPPDRLRGTTGRIYRILWPNASLIDSVLTREHVTEFFVVTNRLIVARDRMRDVVASDGSFRVEEVYEPRGLRLLRVRRVAVDSAGALTESAGRPVRFYRAVGRKIIERYRPEHQIDREPDRLGERIADNDSRSENHGTAPLDRAPRRIRPCHQENCNEANGEQRLDEDQRNHVGAEVVVALTALEPESALGTSLSQLSKGDE
jgi:mannosyltransferase